MKKIFMLFLSLLLCIGFFAGCQSVENHEHSYVKLTLEEGEVVIETYPEVAPESVKLFLRCVKSGYYDGKVFHRSIPGLVQGGSEDGFGVGGSDKTVKGEFSANGIANDLKHERGVISLARTSDMNSASGQFFIMTAAQEYLDGNYAAFGKVVEGMDYIDKIATIPTRGANNDELLQKPRILSAEILKNYTPTTTP